MITQKIYNYFKTQKKDHETKKDSFAPSYLTACRRQIFYKKTETKPSNPITEAALLKMKLGTAAHDMLQKMFFEMGIWIEGEDFKKNSYLGVNFIYRIDGMLEINNIKYLIEIKSVYANGFYAIENEPEKDHVLQLLAYMFFENIDKAILLYIGRDNGRMIEYNLELKNISFLINNIDKTEFIEIFDNYIEKLCLLKQNIIDNNIPDRDFQIQLKNTGSNVSDMFTKDKVKYKTSWRCLYCQFKNLCWKNEYKRILDNSFFINGQFIK